MKFIFFKRIILISAFVSCLFSCSSDLDYEQADDFNIQPVFITNLAYVNGPATNFLYNGVEVPFVSIVSEVDFLTTEFVKDDLVKAEMYFKVKNTIARGFALRVVFYDENDTPLYTLPLNIGESHGTEIVVEHTEIFTAAKVDIIKNTAKMGFSVTMLPGTPITPTTPGRVELSSSLTAYFNVK
ncbi:hypothetical protein [Flavobacterium sp.]|uniref:hypothetical protein n=1 Tax=Flavobacterium sp. TaxID=239 RepID=UPI002BDB8949|nr:hypothetical protein [Flavobacterium sp.]HSD06452.1 hypothetical protein [Flavobacterium sp.]